MEYFIFLMNDPRNAIKKGNIKFSIGMVTLTLLIITIFDSLMRYMANGEVLNFARILMMLIVGVMAYIFDCIIIFAICRLFGGNTSMRDSLSKWGLTFFPNILCSIVVIITEIGYLWLINNSALVLILGIVFIVILIWKLILIATYLRYVVELVKIRFFASFIIITILFVILTLIYSYLGLKVPFV